MKYTKAQRHRIYVRALKRLPEKVLLCWALSEDEGLADLTDFPEVLKHKPKFPFVFTASNVSCWFDIGKTGIKKRAAILRKAIKATE